MARPRPPAPDKSWLFYGDNLEVLRVHIATESVSTTLGNGADATLENEATGS